DIQYRIRCASFAFGRLNHHVFDNHNIRTRTKLLVYKAVVIPTLLYGCEAWVTYRNHLKSLECHHQCYLQKILDIKWVDRRTNASVLIDANTTSIEAMIIQHQLQWTGHCVLMPDVHLPKQLLYSQLSQGQRTRGGQRKRFKDTLKANIKKCGIDIINWEKLARDRATWRLTPLSSLHVRA
uniref:Uncharacterized protein n=1 Tax=Latimeria chalumnae TaxID=7897 RepID=H2ZZZ1_LATCH